MNDNLVDCCIKLVEEEGEGLLALQRCSREQITVPQAELNLEDTEFQSIQEHCSFGRLSYE